MGVKITISEELRGVLNKIKDDSLVAKLLLQEDHSSEYLVDSPANLLSVPEDRTKISYLSSERIPSVDPREYWTSSRRYQTKPGALVAKLFKGIPPIEIEKFSNLFISQSNKIEFRFEIIKGEDIKHYYYYENYSSSNGSLGASCMKHEHCQNYFQLYTENEENVSMLVMFRPGDSRCVGRALLWDFESNKIMDRIYTTNDELFSYYFKQWATENGYFYKSEQNWYNTLYFEQIGQSKKELRMELKLKNSMPSKFPYMDTFKFICMNTGTLYNYLPDGNKGSLRTLCGSEGSTQPHDYLIFDEISYVMRYRNDSAHINYLPTPIYTGRDNAYYSNYNDRWILREHSIYNDIIGDYIFNDEYNMHNNVEIQKIIQKRLAEREEYEAKMKKMVKKKVSSEYTSDLVAELGTVTRDMYMDWSRATSSGGWGTMPSSMRGRYGVVGRTGGAENASPATDAHVIARQSNEISSSDSIESNASDLRNLIEEQSASLESLNSDIDELNTFISDMDRSDISSDYIDDFNRSFDSIRPRRLLRRGVSVAIPMQPEPSEPIDQVESPNVRGVIIDDSGSLGTDRASIVSRELNSRSGSLLDLYNQMMGSTRIPERHHGRIDRIDDDDMPF